MPSIWPNVDREFQSSTVARATTAIWIANHRQESAFLDIQARLDGVINALPSDPGGFPSSLLYGYGAPSTKPGFGSEYADYTTIRTLQIQSSRLHVKIILPKTHARLLTLRKSPIKREYILLRIPCRQ